ncbi:hypothetical protein N9496_01265 [Akkermansiaceae bacterium]|nr:hypothetical protein [Akkermansiaceae bacterium]
MPMNHNGAGVVCPACAHLLQIPSVDQRRMVANARAQTSSKASVSRYGLKKDIGDMMFKETPGGASSDIADDLEPLDAILQPKQLIDDSCEQDDAYPGLPAWEQDRPVAASEPISALTWILSGSLLGVSIVVVSIWLMVQSIDDDITYDASDAVAEPQKDISSIDTRQAEESRMMKQSKKVVVEFLEAKTEADVEGLIRTPEVSVPRLRAWYDRDPWVTPGVRVVGHKNSIIINGDTITMDVQLDNFDIKKIAVVKTVAGYKVDWESWVAWTSVNWQELFDLRPTDPVEVRVLCKRVNYYNRVFNDSTKWFAVRLSHPYSDKSIYGYIDSESPQFHRFITDLVREKEVSATLKIRYPQNSPVGNQVSIVEHMQSGWVRSAASNHEAESPSAH